MTKIIMRTMIIVRALKGTEGREDMRSRIVGLGGGARKAIEKSRFEVGDEGVTMIAGRVDFSSTRGRERSMQMKILVSHPHPRENLVVHREGEESGCSLGVEAIDEDVGLKNRKMRNKEYNEK
jgi:hypothetical protein